LGSKKLSPTGALIECLPPCKHGIILTHILPEEQNLYEKNFLKSQETLVRWEKLLRAGIADFYDFVSEVVPISDLE
jgi:hypothetical protein